MAVHYLGEVVSTSDSPVVFLGAVDNDTSKSLDFSTSSTLLANVSNIVFSPKYGWWHIYMTTLILSILILCTIIGNVFVVAAIILERNLHSVSNYLILSLAVADLMVATLVMPISALTEVSDKWWLGIELCDIWVCFDVLCCTASILHLVAIAIDRYWAVTNIDYIRRRTATRIIMMIGLVWGTSIVISIPARFYHSRSKEQYDLVTKKGLCIINAGQGYTIFSTVGAFYMPMLFMIVIYIRIYQTARARIRKKAFSRPPVVKNNNNRKPQKTPKRMLTNILNNFNEAKSKPTEMIQPEKSASKDDLVAQLSPSLRRPLELSQAIRVTLSPTFNRPALNQRKSQIYSSPAVSRPLLAEEEDSFIDGEDDINLSCYDLREKDQSIIQNMNCANSSHHVSRQTTNSRHIPPKLEATNQISSITLTTYLPSPDSNNASTVSPSNSMPLQKAEVLPLQQFSNNKSAALLSTEDDRKHLVTPSHPVSITGSTANLVTPNHNEQHMSLEAQRDRLEHKRERKAARTLAIITGVFLLCWMPFFLLAVLQPFCPDVCKVHRLIESIFLWLGYLNSILNPVIYTIFAPDFRNAFRKIIFGRYRAQGNKIRR